MASGTNPHVWSKTLVVVSLYPEEKHAVQCPRTKPVVSKTMTKNSDTSSLKKGLWGGVWGGRNEKKMF